MKASALSPRARAALVPAGLIAALLLTTQFAFPGTGGVRGTPFGILFRGVVLGASTALLAAGIVLIYRTVRIINFSGAAMGIPGAVLTFNLILFTPVPFIVALILGLILSAIVGGIMGVLALRFARSPRLVLTVFTILMIFVLPIGGALIDGLGVFPAPQTRPLLATVDDGFLRGELPFAGLSFKVGGFAQPFGYAEIFALQFALLAILAVGASLRYTRTGIALRAVAENADRSSLLGIGTPVLTIIVWSAAGILSGAAAILTGVISAPAAATTDAGAPLLLATLAAAVLGKMRSITTAVACAVGISVLNQAWNWSFSDDVGLFNVLLLVVIAVGLLLQKRGLRRSEQALEESSWKASEEQRPVPVQLKNLRGVRLGRIALISLALMALGVFPFATGAGVTFLVATIAVNSIAVISLVVLTGWTGQVSLGQYAFVAIGSVVGGTLSSKAGVPFLLSLILSAVFVSGLAALVGLPALRIQGLFLLVMTLAFALAVETTLFNERYFGWLLPESVERPSFFFLQFEDERAMYFLCIGALILAIGAVAGLRRSRVGRNLIAIRDNESGARSFGISVVRTKLLGFAISGGLAGFAGALFAHLQRGVSALSFGAEASLELFFQAVFGGVGSVGGALLGSGYFSALEYFFTSPVLIALFGPITTIFLLFLAPAGLISLVNSVRDSFLKIVASRRRMIVPSLIADYDPELSAKQLSTLSPPQATSGLSILGTRRFGLAASIYSSEADGRAGAKARRERAEEASVIVAAAQGDEG